MHPAQSWMGTDGPQLPTLPTPPLDSRSQAGSLTGGHCPSASASLGPVPSQTPRSVSWVPCIPLAAFLPTLRLWYLSFFSLSLLPFCHLLLVCLPLSTPHCLFYLSLSFSLCLGLCPQDEHLPFVQGQWGPW